MAYWVLVDDEESLGVVKDPAPFHAYHTQEQKEEWLDEYRDRIRNRYIAKRNRDPVTVEILLKCWSIYLLNFSLFSSADATHRRRGA